MPRLQALELVPDPDGCAAVRRDWQVLRDAGLPSQLDHRGASNAPHLTVVSAPLLPDEAVEGATRAVGALLPVHGRLSGVLLLGRRRITLARAVEIDDDTAARLLDIRLGVGERQHRGWVPHVTLGRGLDTSAALRAVEVLTREVESVTFGELRRWDPCTGTLTSLASRR